MADREERPLSDRMKETGWVRIGDVHYPPEEKPKPKEEKPDGRI